MPKNIQLQITDSDADFSVRDFHVREQISSIFEIELRVQSTNANADLEGLLGQDATFFLDTGLPGGQRRFHGLVRQATHVKAEASGSSTYEIQIVPHLWLLTQRRNYRIFNRRSLRDIVRSLLSEWHVEFEDALRRDYPVREFRVQYGESDYTFACRTMEDAGISFHFVEDAASCCSRVVLTDAPEQAEPRAFGPVRYAADIADTAHHAYLTRARLSCSVRPRRVTLRDPDFRRRPDAPLFGRARAAKGQDRLEIYRFEPGAFVDDKASRSPTPRDPHDAAGRQLDVERGDATCLAYRTNAFDLHPGTVFSVQDHPCSTIESGSGFLACALRLQGSHDGQWRARGRAVPASQPHRPARRTPKPRAFGVQSATVVGPAGEDVHTDPFGRVKVQFTWDREGQFDQDSSCWVRVSQAWAGAGYGMMAVPRIGHEVLVAFVEGDPDHPVIVGRVHGGTTPTPHDLPAKKTMTVLRGCSSPDHEGANEIHFEDASGHQLLYVHAERDLRKIVKASELETTGESRTIVVGASRATTIGQLDKTVVGQRFSVSVEGPETASRTPTGIEMSDGRIVLSTGEARLVLDGPDVFLEAPGAIRIHSTDDDVLIQGGPNVRLNCGLASSKRDLELRLVDPFGNPIRRSWLAAEVRVDGQKTEVHEGFTGSIARRAVGKSAVVRLAALDAEDDDEGDE